MSNSKLSLYSSYRSSSAWRIRIVLSIKGIEYDYLPVNLLKKEKLSEKYLAVNPMGQVPALLVQGQALTQSASIFEYLEEAYPDKALLPKDKLKRAKVRELAEIIISGIQPMQSLSFLEKLPEEKRKDLAFDAISKGFTALEALLKKSSGKYCVGDELSWADCCLLPQISNAKSRYAVEIEKYPNIHRIGSALDKLEPFVSAHPTNQPDCPEELRTTGM